jgi:hypothetical protein
MAATQYGDCNAVARVWDWVNELGLGVDAFANSSDTRTSKTVGIGVNLRQVVCVKPSTGTITVEIKLGDGTADITDFSSPDASVVAPSTGGFVDFATTDAKKFFAIKLTPSTTLTNNKKLVTSFDKMPLSHSKPQGYHEAESAFNKVPQTTSYAPVSL